MGLDCHFNWDTKSRTNKTHVAVLSFTCGAMTSRTDHVIVGHVRSAETYYVQVVVIRHHYSAGHRRTYPATLLCTSRRRHRNQYAALSSMMEAGAAATLSPC